MAWWCKSSVKLLYIVPFPQSLFALHESEFFIAMDPPVGHPSVPAGANRYGRLEHEATTIKGVGLRLDSGKFDCGLTLRGLQLVK